MQSLRRSSRRRWILTSAALLGVLFWQNLAHAPTTDPPLAEKDDEAKPATEKKKSSSPPSEPSIVLDKSSSTSLADPRPEIPWEPLQSNPSVLKKVLSAGRQSGPFPTLGATVEVHYTGTLPSSRGKKFDSSRDRGNPFVFTLGRGSVIQCWELGIASMRFGEKAVLRCPPGLAYGSRGFPPVIPGDATLDFEVELLPPRV